MLAIESKEENMNHTSNNPKIYKPKPKKLFNSYLPPSCTKKKTINKKKSSTAILNHKFNFDFKDDFIGDKKNKQEINNLNKRTKLEIENISFKEMEEDFSKLKEKEEIRKAENELLFLLRSSTKDYSQDEKENESIKVKRPKNPFAENFQ